MAADAVASYTMKLARKNLWRQELAPWCVPLYSVLATCLLATATGLSQDAKQALTVTKSFVIMPDTSSPDGRYAVAWGLPKHPEIWELVYQFEAQHPTGDETLEQGEGILDRVLEVEDDVENYIVDVSVEKIVHKLKSGYWTVGTIRSNRHHLEVLWARSGDFVLINQTFRWDCVSFCAVPIKVSWTGSELDLNKILGEAVRSLVAKSFPRGSHYSKKDLDVSFSNVDQTGDNQFSVQADAEIGKDWSADTVTIDFSLRPNGQLKVLRVHVST